MLSNEEIVRLLDIANAGVHRGQVAAARTIYEGVLAAKPGHVPAIIGQAYSHIVVSDFDTAETILREQVLADHPDDADALAALGLNLMLAGRKDEAKEVLSSIGGEGSTAREMATRLLEQI